VDCDGPELRDRRDRNPFVQRPGFRGLLGLSFGLAHGAAASIPPTAGATPPRCQTS
jgi:hypothetical protein